MQHADTINKILIEELGVLEEEIRADSRLDSDLGADSLDRASIATALEDEFSIIVSDEDIEDCSNVADVYALVDARLNAPSE